MLVRQYLSDPSQPNPIEWNQQNTLFQTTPFSISNRARLQQVWIVNQSPYQMGVRISPNAIGNNTLSADMQNEWVSFRETESGTDEEELTIGLAPAGETVVVAGETITDTATYWIHLEIDDDTIYNSNISNLFPIAALNINTQVVITTTEDVVTRYAINNEAGFLAGSIGPVRTDNRVPALIYDDFALRANPSRLGITGYWTRQFDLEGISPYKITSIGYSMTIPPRENGTLPNVRVTLTRANKYTSYPDGEEDRTPFNPAPSPIYDKTFSAEQLHGLGSIDGDGNAVITQTDQISPVDGQGFTILKELLQAQLTIVPNQQVNPIQSPEVRGIIITVQGTYETNYTYHSYIRYSTTPALPDGVSIINANGTRVELIEKDMAKFEFGYNRVGGNDTFTLDMRWDWDYELPFDYDDRVIYVRNGEVWYQGIIDAIRPKLSTKRKYRHNRCRCRKAIEPCNRKHTILQ